MKHIPNAISIFRLVTIGFLLFIARLENPLPFVLLFILIGMTDALDGYIARKYHLESELGAKLDNIADTMVFVVGFVSLIFLRQPVFDGMVRCLIVLFIGVALKVFSFTLTKVRFKEWNSMHTYSNKALGCVMFSAVPVFFYLKEINFTFVLITVLLMTLTVAEDTYILMTSETYNVDHKGLIGEKLADKKKRAS